eukprot:snap_masked-scaffold_41-processed-gene-2.64-mRNA-1 protein AED:0.01 eAED:0.01 QI:0/-1/0/1/-1/1/1/0/282
MSKPNVLIVIPCYEEALNIQPLLKRLSKSLSKFKWRIILVDDFSASKGGSEDSRLALDDYLQHEPSQESQIFLYTRTKEEGKGLSSAVLFGLRQYKKLFMDKKTMDCFVVMDADLQHEPESVPSLINEIVNKGKSFSVGSRNVGGGEYDGMSFIRRIISFGATMLTLPFTKVTDPMSGFFAFSNTTMEKAESQTLNPLGYKIGLELLVKSGVECDPSKVSEVPIVFKERVAGESKLTAMQFVLYLLHVLSLAWFKSPSAVLGCFALLVVTGLSVLYFLINFF